MIHYFGGPVFEPEDIPKLIALVLFMASPYIILAIAFCFFIYDTVKKKLRRSTLILSIVGLLLLLVTQVLLADRF